MELPKNITQIGEADRNCRVYVEDYVVSYIKQINRVACDKEMAVALYGTKRVEDDIIYLFIYGAAKLNFLQRETRHLSQAQQQEIERLRQRYFAEYGFQGYRLLNGEMVEGFHICEQDICRYIPGYAQFYEKNDCMLAYMLETRSEEAAPEAVSREKYDAVKKRQEERRENHQVVNDRVMSQSLRKMRISTAAVFGILCFVGLMMLWRQQGMEGIQVAARQAISELAEQRLPDAWENADGEGEVSTLIAEDKLAEAVLAENLQNGESEPAVTPEPDVIAEAVATPEPDVIAEAVATPEPDVVAEAVATPDPGIIPEPDATASYVIQKGDTLIDICIRQYGNVKKVQEICMLNEIEDADDIKIGQKILLP